MLKGTIKRGALIGAAILALWSTAFAGDDHGGAARSIALAKALKSVCATEIHVNEREIDQMIWMLEHAFPPKDAKAFQASLAGEEARVRAEIGAAGAGEWCATQKDKFTRANGGRTPLMFR
ncbi:hypothetical protein [Methylocystis sp. JR02]|uniref:hypothetical protein n=1 Tax=Methylocystis sp. JR02 TaxID=3046284 RepID=UPI0024BB3993|nr:hypothetical protein [Methylocystis sp. JR02]MDJ0447325.1 hypothetical protein [Methylocystis sp. JR02]